MNLLRSYYIQKIDRSAKLQLPFISARKRYITGATQIHHLSLSLSGFQLVRPPFAARFFPAERTSKKQREYKDDNLRLSLLAQRIDFTGFHERAQ